MKKFKIFLGIFIVLAVAIGGGLFYLNMEKQSKALNETIDLLNSKATGIYYLYHDECSWCEDFKPVFDEVTKEKKESTRSIDVRHKLLSKSKKQELKSSVKDLTDEDEIIVPLVIFISEDGTTQSHIGTLNTHDATQFSLSGKQREKLKIELEKMYDNFIKHNKQTTAPSKKETKSSKKETTSSKKKTTPSEEETTSSKKGTTSSKKGTTSSKKKTTPSKKKTTPSKKKTTSSKKEVVF